MRRVVVTGLGAVSPLGNDVATTWDGLVAGKSGIDFIQGFDASDYPVRIGAEVKDFDPVGLAPPKELRKLARYTQFSLAAGKEAVDDAGLLGAYAPERIGIVFGSAVGDIGGIATQEQTRLERGHSRVAPWFIPSVLTDAASGQLAIAFGFKGVNFACVAACATGSYAIGEGAEIVRRGAADAILAGGAEAALTPLILAGFCNMRGLAAEEEYPPRASRPFDATRDGFVIGEGAGVVALESLDHARARGAQERPGPPRFPVVAIAPATMARAPACWCWKSWRRRAHAERRSTPRSFPTAPRTTRSTSRSPTPRPRESRA